MIQGKILSSFVASDVSIVFVNGNNYRIHFWYISNSFFCRKI